MLKHLLALLLIALCPLAQAATGSADISWGAAVKNVDGSALTNLGGYRVYSGTSPGALTLLLSISNPAANGTMILGLAPGVWYFSVSAINTAGEESALAGPVSTTVVAAPPLLTLGPYGYESTTNAAGAPTMSAIGLVQAGAPCGPATKTIGTTKFCQITNVQIDVVGWPVDKTLAKGIWAKSQ